MCGIGINESRILQLFIDYFIVINIIINSYLFVSSGSSKSNLQGSGSKVDRKRERGGSEEKVVPGRSATPESSTVDTKPSASPPSKKHKAEFSTSTISEEEVKRYLQRRPIGSKDLVRKFLNKKTGMDRNKIVEVLHAIIENLPHVKKEMVKEKLYLSLPSNAEQ